jgi:hypothetical protein
MISTEGQRQATLVDMRVYRFRHRLAYSRHKTRVLEDANRGIIRKTNILELMVSVKLDFPPELGELSWKTGLDEVNRARVYTWFWLEKVCSAISDRVQLVAQGAHLAAT